MTAATDRMRVAVDLGGTKIAAARVQGALVAERRQAETPRTGDPDRLVAAIVDLVAGWPEAERGIAVATTGLVRGGCLTAINPDTLPGPDRYPLHAALVARGYAPAVIVNDAQAAAWGEFRHGNGRGAGSMVFLTVSTGIGGGLVLDGRLIQGPGGLAGHLGHMVDDPAGPTCGCGRTGCLEAVASGAALARAAQATFGPGVTVPNLFSRARSDDAARALIRRSAESVARTLCDLRAALDIERAVIGGGVGLADGYLALVRQAIDAAPPVFRMEVHAAALGADAGLIGAADLSRDGPYPHPL